MAEGRVGSEWVCVAAVATAHGVRGALKLRTFTERPEDVAAYGPLYNRRGERLFELQIIGRAAGGVIARAPGIEDRDAALALRGQELFVPRAALPDLDADEFYVSDLEGLTVELAGGHRLGAVRAVENHGAGDVLEIVADDGRTLALPFDRETVPEIDVGGGRVVVAPPPELAAEFER
jgi:16S rRNA processing protein RimM